MLLTLTAPALLTLWLWLLWVGRGETAETDDERQL